MTETFVAFAATTSLIAAAPAQHYAPAGITSAELLERVRGAEADLSTGGYYATVRSVSNRGVVVITEMLWSGSDYKVTAREAGFTTSYGEYRGTQWYQNANGIVLSSSGEETDDPFALVLNRMEASADDVKLLGLTGDATAAYVVDVTPKYDFEQLRYYDTKTYLPSRVEITDYNGRKNVWIYKSYSNTAGPPFPSAIDQETDGVVTTRRTLVTFRRVSAGTLDLSIPASKFLFDMSPHEAVDIPASFTDEGIMVQAEIDGRGLDFLLDSGSSDLLIDRSVAQELAASVTGDERVTFAGDYAGAKVRVPKFSVAGLSARDVTFATADFHLRFRELPGHRVVGLLGSDLIATGPMEVNFQKQKLTLFRTLPSDLRAQGWSVLPLILVDRIPVVKAAYSGKIGQFVVDLGDFYSELFPRYFSQFPIKVPKGMGDQGYVAGLSLGQSGIKYFTMNRLIFGDYVFGDVQVFVPSSPSSQQPEFDGLIGRNTLSLFNLIFDYKDGELWFKPINFENK